MGFRKQSGEKRTHKVVRLFTARRPITRVRISPQRPDASQSEFALLGDCDAHALQNAEDVSHDLHGRGRSHRRRVDGSLVNANAEVLGRGWRLECRGWHGLSCFVVV